MTYVQLSYKMTKYLPNTKNYVSVKICESFQKYTLEFYHFDWIDIFKKQTEKNNLKILTLNHIKENRSAKSLFHVILIFVYLQHLVKIY